MLKIADGTLLDAIVAGFNAVPELMRSTTPELLDSEAKKLLVTLVGTDNIDKAFKLARFRAQELLVAQQAEEKKEMRALLREQKKQQELADAVERERIANVAKVELEIHVAKLLESKSLSRPQMDSLRYFKKIYLEGKKDQDIAYLFPGTSRDQRYQWKTRANKMIAPYVSEDARKFISEKSKTKFASIDVLLKISEAFFKKCLEV